MNARLSCHYCNWEGVEPSEAEYSPREYRKALWCFNATHDAFCPQVMGKKRWNARRLLRRLGRL